MNVLNLFCIVDDFCKKYEERYGDHYILPYNNTRKYRTIKPKLSLSEMMTIIIGYSFSPCKNFKFYYLTCVKKSDFKNLVSYDRFVSLIKRTMHPLMIFSQMLFGEHTGNYYIDSTKLPVCHNKRTNSHKVFDGLADLGKSSMGWFFGFKLHFIINEKGEPINYCFTKASVDDRKPVLNLTKNLVGFLFADKGYIDFKNLFKKLYQNKLKLITGIKKNMKNRLLSIFEKIMLRKRSVIESVFNILKNTFNIDHTRHRNPLNAFTHIIATIVAYSLKINKPAIKKNMLVDKI